MGERHPLTGLYFGSAYFAEAEVFLKESDEKTYCMLAIDVEHFGLFNQIHGEDEGDKLLLVISDLLKEYKKELTEIIERTNYHETDVEKEKTWDDLLYTEEEIRLYMKEAPAPFDPETIFTTSEEVEEQTDNLQKELNESRLVKRLTPSKNNGNK